MKKSISLLCGAVLIAAGCTPWIIQSQARTKAPTPKVEDVAAKTGFALQTGVHVCGVAGCDHDHHQSPTYQKSLKKYNALMDGTAPDRSLGPVSACFHPDTPPETVSAFMDALRNVSDGAWPGGEEGPEYFIGTGWSGTTITWSFVPDGLSISGAAGEPTAPSEIFSRMDSLFAAQGGRATWIARFQAIFDRWEQLSGVDFVRVTSGGNDWDDGAAWGTGSGATRGAIRISMKNIDGTNGILAYNFFPNNGDMVIDRSENWGSSTNFHRFLRNTVAHENGHGMAIEHVCSNNSAQLMEPFLSTAFDGPQHDDIRAMQRLYGDAQEPNASTGAATSIGVIPTNNSVVQVGDVPPDQNHPTMPIPGSSSTLSLHVGSDNDFYSFTVNSSATLNVFADPIGFTYDNNAQAANGSCPTGSSVNSLAQANLRFQILGTNGTTVLLTADSAAVGLTESGSVSLPAAGTYFIRVYPNGTVPQTQLYKLRLQAQGAVNQPPVLGNIGARTFPELANFTLQATATDPDAGQTLTYSLQSAPSGMTITPGGLISWTPTEVQGPGSYTFNVVVTDNGSPVASDSETVTWNVTEVNSAPVLTIPSSINVNEGNTASFTATATDSDNPANTLTYALISPPSGASINPTTGVFSFTPTGAQLGQTFNIQVRVTDNGSPILSDTETVTINSIIVNKTITGTVTLNDWIPDEAGTGFTFELMNVGGSTPIQTATGTLGASGVYGVTVTGLVGGTYDLYIKSSHWLRQKVGSVSVSPAGGSADFSLINGDVNNDNEVGPADFALLSAAFGTFLGDPGYSAAADLNGDEEIGPADFAILSANFGTFGD